MLHLTHLIVEVGRFPETSSLFDSLRCFIRLREELRDVELPFVNLVPLLLAKPLYTTAVFPEAELEALLLRVDIGSDSVLLTLVPPAVVFAAICPVVDAEALFFVVQVLAIIPNSV